jgi:CubicO group peptidase (beta-lactamase class C family)
MCPRRAVLCFLALLAAMHAAMARGGSNPDPPLIERSLEITRPGASVAEALDLTGALAALTIPSVSIAIIDHDRIVWARAFGADATPRTLFQAASLSKLVTAVAALRLVQDGRLNLDRDVNAELTEWHVPPSAMTGSSPVTLRGLLSMTAGIGVPGYLGYAPGAPLPNLTQILDGIPPANSPPVRVEAVPGQRYAYSGGGYEIVQAIIQDATHQSFDAAMQRLVLRPVGMADSAFVQPLPASLVARAATGHSGDGNELPGGWRVVPELAAGGLWSTPTDLARLLIAIAGSYRGKPSALLVDTLARSMLARQNGGPYGLGGAVSGFGRDLVLMKRGQNIGYQSYLLVFPNTGQGIVVMTNSDSGTILATALVRRAAQVYRWPMLDGLPD